MMLALFSPGLLLLFTVPQVEVPERVQLKVRVLRLLGTLWFRTKLLRLLGPVLVYVTWKRPSNCLAPH